MNKLNFSLLIIGTILVLAACGGGDSKNPNSGSSSDQAPKSMIDDKPAYDPNRGEGKFSSENLTLTDQIDVTMADEGFKIQGVKCSACHKLTDEKLVGPGWKGVTIRRKPEWIMNFITNPDAMIDKDPAVQAQLELCLVRMPNQSLTDTDARNLLEFMRRNDAAK